MKKLIALLLVAALALTLAACGGAGNNNTTEPVTDAPATDAPAESTEELTDAPADEPQDDAAAIAALQERLTGEWGFPGDGREDIEHLTFNADGTGSYKGLSNSYTFNYVVYIDHRTYNNGDPYTENILKITYDTGDVEEFIFFFNRNGQMAFHNFDNGGYIGLIDNTDVFTKE